MIKIGLIILGTIIGLVVGFCLGVRWISKQYDIHCEKIEKIADKFSDYYAIMHQWMRLIQKGHNLSNYCEKNQYKRVAIYGLNDIAYTIINELNDFDTKIAFCIDRNADNLFSEIDLYRPDEDMPDVDVCIVAIPELYREITEVLKGKMNCPIISIEDIIWEL